MSELIHWLSFSGTGQLMAAIIVGPAILLLAILVMRLFLGLWSRIPDPNMERVIAINNELIAIDNDYFYALERGEDIAEITRKRDERKTRVRSSPEYRWLRVNQHIDGHFPYRDAIADDPGR